MTLKFRITTPGKHDRNVKGLIDEYEKRVSRFAELDWQIVQGDNQASEIASIKKALSNSKYIVLDERGTNVTTNDIAVKIESLTNQGNSEIVVVIGGAYGLDDELRNGAESVWAFGAITLPHQLIRIIAAEQIYRAMTILSNHPYHHS